MGNLHSIHMPKEMLLLRGWGKAPLRETISCTKRSGRTPQAFAVAMSAFVIVAPAFGQRVNDNATLLADDAFGAAVGSEGVGLYNGFNVRGFSAITAANVRLEGMYIDRPAEFSDRLISTETIKVGITSQNYLFTAPTGVDDFKFRPTGGKALVSAVASYSDLGVARLEFDGQLPLLDDMLGLAGGA